MSLCPSHSVTRVSVKWAHPPCWVVVGNGCAKLLIQSLALHGLRNMAVLVSRTRCIVGPPKPNQPSFVKSLPSQGWWEVGEKQPGVQGAPNFLFPFPCPTPTSSLTTHTRARHTCAYTCTPGALSLCLSSCYPPLATAPFPPLFPPTAFRAQRSPPPSGAFPAILDDPLSSLNPTFHNQHPKARPSVASHLYCLSI